MQIKSPAARWCVTSEAEFYCSPRDNGNGSEIPPRKATKTTLRENVEENKSGRGTRTVHNAQKQQGQQLKISPDHGTCLAWTTLQNVMNEVFFRQEMCSRTGRVPWFRFCFNFRSCLPSRLLASPLPSFLYVYIREKAFLFFFWIRVVVGPFPIGTRSPYTAGVSPFVSKGGNDGGVGTGQTTPKHEHGPPYQRIAPFR